MSDLPSEFLSPDTVAAAAADAALRDAAALDWRAAEAVEADDSGLLGRRSRDYGHRTRLGGAPPRGARARILGQSAAVGGLSQAAAGLALGWRAVAVDGAGDDRRCLRHLGASGLAADAMATRDQAAARERRIHSSRPMRPRRASPNGTNECSSTWPPQYPAVGSRTTSRGSATAFR